MDGGDGGGDVESGMEVARTELREAVSCSSRSLVSLTK